MEGFEGICAGFGAEGVWLRSPLTGLDPHVPACRRGTAARSPQQSPLVSGHPSGSPSIAACKCRVPRVAPAGSQFQLPDSVAGQAWDFTSLQHLACNTQKYLPRSHRACFLNRVSRRREEPACLFPVFTLQSRRAPPVSARRLQTARCERRSGIPLASSFVKTNPLFLRSTETFDISAARDCEVNLLPSCVFQQPCGRSK